MALVSLETDSLLVTRLTIGPLHDRRETSRPENHTMALSQSALLEVLEGLKASHSTNVIRQALQVMLQQLIDAETTALIGAEPHQRTEAWTILRNGHQVEDDHDRRPRPGLVDHQAAH